MVETVIGPWRVLHDPDLTRRLYAQVREGGAASCACLHCRNAMAAPMPREIVALLDELGIDPSKDAETNSYGSPDSACAVHHYSRWYHFVGRIIEGPSTNVQTASNDPAAWSAELSPQVSLTLRNGRDLVHPPLASRQVLQIEFYFTLPWVLDEPPTSLY